MLAGLLGLALFLAYNEGRRLSIRNAWARSFCRDNLKQIGIALYDYHEAYGSFPPAFTTDAEGRRLHSWRVLLLPYLDKRELYDQIRLDEPWDSPHNASLAAGMPEVFRCPADLEAGELDTSYVMIVGPDTFADLPLPRSPSSIPDGAANTMIVAEMSDSAVHWMQPEDLRSDQMVLQVNAPVGEGIRSGHVGFGANALFCDGASYTLPESIEPKQLKALFTPAGGEPTYDLH